MRLTSNVLRSFSGVMIALSLAAEIVYGVAVCKYTPLGPLIMAAMLLVPSAIWHIRRRYAAAAIAATGLLPWIAWVHHIQCVSDVGPFVGGLGPIYLVVGGLVTSTVLGVVAYFILDRQMAPRNK